MKPEKISDAMNDIDESIIEETQNIRLNKKKRMKSAGKWIALAASLAAAVLVIKIVNSDQQNATGQITGQTSAPAQSEFENLTEPAKQGATGQTSALTLSPNSTNVTVTYIGSGDAGTIGSEYTHETDAEKATTGSFDPSEDFAAGDSIQLTEDELFTAFHTAVFKGTITGIRNIELDFNGSKNEGAIAEIRIETVYRGTCKEGEITTVLLPCMIGELVTGENNVVSAMRTGMTGIFMPIIYDETSIWEENGAKLVKTDLAPYGFADGSRYAFLETEDGLIFDKQAYSSIADAVALEEISQYVQNMLNKE